MITGDEALHLARKYAERLSGGNSKEARAIDSEAWAVGKREGVDVGQADETFHNNSKYYADRAEQGAAAAGYMDLYINDNGHLIYTRTDNVDNDFNIDSNGHLIWVNGTEEEEP